MMIVVVKITDRPNTWIEVGSVDKDELYKKYKSLVCDIYLEKNTDSYKTKATLTTKHTVLLTVENIPVHSVPKALRDKVNVVNKKAQVHVFRIEISEYMYFFSKQKVSYWCLPTNLSTEITIVGKHKPSILFESKITFGYNNEIYLMLKKLLKGIGYKE